MSLKKHPAFFSACGLCLGTAFSLSPHFVYPLALFLLCLSERRLKTLLIASACFLIGACLATGRISHLSLETKLIGKGTFFPETIKIYESPFGKSYLYQGTLKNFQDLPPLPCRIFLPLKETRPKGDFSYQITGTLEQKAPFIFILKPDKTLPWIPLKKRYTLTELRFQAKQAFLGYLKKTLHDKTVVSFLHALATGDVNERILSTQLGKVGLQHLLAVSGFHFAILNSFLTLVFQLICPRKPTLYLLLISLSLYFVFLGSSPSVERAWLSGSLVLVGHLFGLYISGINAWSISLLFALLKDPLVLLHLGFQMSFLCTLAILLFTPLIGYWIDKLFVIRSFGTVLEMNPLNQYGYIALGWLKKALSLNLAVHLLSLPPLLFLFHRFPWVSFAYNLFFPFWISISLVLLLLSLLLTPIGFLSTFLHKINESWTHFALEITNSPPATLDFVLRTSEVSLPIVVVFLGGITAWGLLQTKVIERRKGVL